MISKKKLLSIFSVAFVLIFLLQGKLFYSLAEIDYNFLEMVNIDDTIKYGSYCEKEGMTEQKIFYSETALNDKYSLVVNTIRENDKYVVSTVKDIALDYENRHKDYQVMLAVNGGFFDGAFNNDENLPEGGLIVDGVLLDDGSASKINHNNGVGWNKDGFIDSGAIENGERSKILRITLQNGEREIFNLEEDCSSLENYGISLVNRAGSYCVKNSYRFLLSESNSDSKYLKFDNIKCLNSTPDTNNFTVADGENVLVLRESNYAVECLKDAIKCEIYNRTDGKFNKADYYVDTFNNLVNNGKVATGFSGGGHSTTKAPRTTIGFTDDGKVFLSVVDGRQPSYSIGFTSAEQANFAISMGCKYAYELDGGGSSTFLVRDGNQLKTVNSCSDGTMRKVLSSIMIVKKVEKKHYDILTNEESINVTVGGKYTIKLVEDISAEDVDFVSSDNSVFCVDKQGNIEGIKSGIAELTLSYQDTETTVVVIVKIIDNQKNTSNFGNHMILLYIGIALVVFVIIIAVLVILKLKKRRGKL